MSNEINLAAFAAAIKAKRGKEGLRFTGTALNISAATLSRLENGKLPDLTSYIRVCNWLGVPLSTFQLEPWEIRVKRNLLALGCNDPDQCAGNCLVEEAKG